MPVSVEELLAHAGVATDTEPTRRQGVKAAAPAPPGAEEPESDQSQSSLGRIAAQFADVPSAFKRGLTRSPGAYYLGVTPDAEDPNAGYLTKAVEGLGHAAGDPLMDAAMVFPPAAVPLMALSGGENARIAARRAGRSVGLGEWGKAAAVGGITGVGMGFTGVAGRALGGRLAAPLGETAAKIGSEAGALTGEGLGMGAGGATVAAGFEGRYPTAEELKEGAATGVLTVGALRGGSKLARLAARGVPQGADSITKPVDAAVNETAKEAPGTGAGGTPPDDTPDYMAQPIMAQGAKADLGAWAERQAPKPYPNTGYGFGGQPVMEAFEQPGRRMTDEAPVPDIGDVEGPGAEPSPDVPTAAPSLMQALMTARWRRPEQPPQAPRPPWGPRPGAGEVAAPETETAPTHPFADLPTDQLQLQADSLQKELLKKTRTEVSFRAFNPTAADAMSEITAGIEAQLNEAKAELRRRAGDVQATAEPQPAPNEPLPPETAPEPGQEPVPPEAPPIPPEAPAEPGPPQEPTPPPDEPQEPSQAQPEASPEEPPPGPEGMRQVPANRLRKELQTQMGRTQADRVRDQLQQAAATGDTRMENGADSILKKLGEERDHPIGAIRDRAFSSLRRRYAALEREVRGLTERLVEAHKAGNVEETDRLNATIDQLSADAARIQDLLQGKPPPGEPAAAAPEASPPPEPEPPNEPPAEPEPESAPSLPPERVSEFPTTPMEQTLAARRAFKLSEGELDTIERRGRGGRAEGIKPTSRTSDQILHEIDLLQQAKERGAQNKPGMEMANRVDASRTPEELDAQIKGLTDLLVERQRYPIPVRMVVDGLRGIYVQKAGEPMPVREFQELERYTRNLSYHRLAGYDVLYNNDVVSDRDVVNLAIRGRLHNLVEELPPDTRTPPGNIAEGSPTGTRSNVALTKSATPGGVRVPKGRENQRGALTFGVEPAPDHRLMDPALEAEIAHPESGTVSRWQKSAKDVLGRMLKGWRQIMEFAPDIHPREFKNDPIFKRFPEQAKLLQEHIELAGKQGTIAYDYMVHQLDRIMRPITSGPLLRRTSDFEFFRRIVAVADKLADAERGNTPSRYTQEQLRAEYKSILDRAPERVRQSFDQYQKVMREIAEEGVRREWFSPDVLQRTSYFPHLIRDLQDAINSLYQNIPRELREANSGWRQYRVQEAGPEHYQDMMTTIGRRLMSHSAAVQMEDLAEKVLPVWDALPHLTREERAHNWGTPEVEQARQAMMESGGRRVIRIKDAHGNPHEYVPYSFIGTKWKVALPSNDAETALLDRFARRERLKPVLLPKAVAERMENLVRPKSVLEIARGYERFERAARRWVLITRGLPGVVNDTVGDLFSLYQHLRWRELQSGGRFLKELSAYVGSGMTEPPPLLTRALKGMHLPGESAADREFIDLVQRQQLAGSTYYGNPTEHIMMRRLKGIERATKLPLTKEGVPQLGNAAERLAHRGVDVINQAADRFQILPQTLSATMKALIAHGNWERAQRGEKITSYAVDVDGLPVEYQIGALARASLQNYDRLPGNIQRSVGRYLLRFVGFPYLEGKKFGRQINQTGLIPLGRMVTGKASFADFKAMSDLGIRIGLPLFLAYQQREHLKTLWNDVKNNGGYASELMFTVPLAKKDEDGNQAIFVPSTGFDYAPQVIAMKAVTPAVKEWVAKRIDTPTFLQRIIPDAAAFLGKEAMTRLTPLLSIPMGWSSGKDPRTGRRIVEGPPEMLLSDEGKKQLAVWTLKQVFAAYGMLEKTADRAQMSPGLGTSVMGTKVPALRTAAEVVSQKLNPADAASSVVYYVDPQKLMWDAQSETITKHIPEEAETTYLGQQAVGQDLGSGGTTHAVQDRLNTIAEQMRHGRFPPKDLGDHPSVQTLLAAMREHMTHVTTKPEIDQDRHTIQNLLRIASMERAAALQKAHPSSALRALQESPLHGP